jgi:hypothetical protein
MDGWIVSGEVVLLHAGHKTVANVHHGLSLMSQSLIFIRPWFMAKKFFVLHVFWLK